MGWSPETESGAGKMSRQLDALIRQSHLCELRGKVAGASEAEVEEVEAGLGL